jgi:hypothetical protein
MAKVLLKFIEKLLRMKNRLILQLKKNKKLFRGKEVNHTSFPEKKIEILLFNKSRFVVQ